MANFNFPIKTNNTSSVNEIISEAIDHNSLQQLSSINNNNTSSFSTTSILSSDLETRFQRLKTFPSSSKTKPHLSPNSLTSSKHPKYCNTKKSSILKVNSCDGVVNEGKKRTGSSSFEGNKTGMGWLWCYPKRVTAKDKRKMMKEAMREKIKEAEKVRKETEKVVKMAKQFAKSDFSFVDNELSDDDGGNAKRNGKTR